MPQPPSLFMPSKRKPGPTSPVSPEQRMSLEERKRAMMEDNPESYRNESKFGPIDGIPVGKTWNTREECAKDGVHAHLKAGIWGGKDGAYSIVMSGGYEDDVDHGENITYTGTGGFGDENRYGGGGNGWGKGIQIEDQTFDHKHNEALQISCKSGRPVRVIRGYALGSKYAPYSGYRYDGLYKVTKAYMHKAKGNPYEVCRFELVREPGQGTIPTRLI